MKKTKYSLIFLLLFVLMPVTASANAVWPSLYIAEGMRSWYIILIGFLIEVLFVKYFLKESFLKSVLISFVMNFVSCFAGVVIIPVSGFLGEFLMIPLGTGTFHPTHWVMSYVLAILSNVLIEGITVNVMFKHGFKKMFWWLFLANAISVIICILFHGVAMQNI